MRRRSYSPSPPRYSRRRRSPSPHGRYGGHSSRDGPTSLLVRNLRLDCRPDDLRRPFGQFGELKDVYLPRDYYTGEPRGFGFVQFLDPEDAVDAKHHMDGQVFQGRQLTVVYAEENRKKPNEMRARDRGRGLVYDRRRSLPGYSRSPGNSRSPPRRFASSRGRDYHSPPPRRREYSRSISPLGKRYSQERPLSRDDRERSFSRSPGRYSRSPSRSPVRDQSPPYDSESPVRDSSPGSREA